jgi:hypothetical protein
MPTSSFTSSTRFSPSHHGFASLTMRHRSYLGSLNRQRSVLIIAIVVLFVLFESLPLPRARPDARFEVSQNRPRYLHQSPFRTNPDYEYEIKLSNALRDLEIEGQLRGEEGSPDTVWQIMLMDNDKRGDDSFQFEKKNSEWNYSVRHQQSLHPHCP